MSKGLEALNGLIACAKTGSSKDICLEIEKLKQIIENELKELEERRDMMRRFNEACVPTILDNQTEKKLKALEIIKNMFYNEVDITHFLNELDEYENYEDFAFDYSDVPKEEYDLLKEVFYEINFN